VVQVLWVVAIVSIGLFLIGVLVFGSYILSMSIQRSSAISRGAVAWSSRRSSRRAEKSRSVPAGRS